MVDTNKVIKSLRRKLSKMTPESREAYFSRMGLEFDEKAISRKNESFSITLNRAQLVNPANSTTFAYRASLPQKPNRVCIYVKGNAHVRGSQYERKKKKVYE